MKKVVIWLAVISIFTLHVSIVSAKTNEAELIHQLIEMPSTSYDSKEANAMIGRIERISPEILKGLVQKDVKIRLINGKLTDEPEYLNLKGVTPRGWEGTGKTWDDIPGVGGNPVILRIGYSETGKGHGSLNLELHETSHAIDMFVFNSISQSEKFKDLFTKEADLLFPKDAYMDSYPEEYFAETSCMYFYSDKTRNQIKESAPLSYAFLSDLYGSYKNTVTFNDLQATHWAYADIYKAVDEGYVSGYMDGSFHPDKEITRAEFVKMLISALGLQSRSQHADEPWYVPYLETATEKSIVSADNLSNKNWNTPIARKEMAELCIHTLHLSDDTEPLQLAVKKGILQGTENGIEPDHTSTRAQSVTVIERTLGLLHK